MTLLFHPLVYSLIIGFLVGGFAAARTGLPALPLVLLAFGGAFFGYLLSAGSNPAVHFWPILTDMTVPILMAILFVIGALIVARRK